MGDPIEKSDALDWVLTKIAASKKSPTVGTSTQKPLPTAKPDLKDLRARELDLWKDWKKSKYHPEKLDPLLQSYDRLLQTNINKFKNKVEVPTSAIDFEAKRLFVNALKDWDPKGGASLPSYINLNLKKLGRFVQTVQNFARLPENLIRHVGTYQSVKADLSERLGHEPDDLTLFEAAHEINPKITMGHIKRLNTELRKGLITTGHEASDVFKSEDQTPRQKEVIGLIYHQLTPEERSVHEYWWGLNGKPTLSTSQIAKKMKWDDPKVSKLKKSIWSKMEKYL